MKSVNFKEQWFQTLLIYGLMGISFFCLFPDLHNIVEYGFFALLVVWIGNLFKWRMQDGAEKPVLQKTPLDFMFLLFLLWILVTVPWAIDPAYSFAEWRKTLAQTLMFYFVVNVVTTKEEVGKIVDAFLLGIVVMSVAGIGNFLLGDRDVFGLDERAGAFGLASQWLSTFLIMGIPIFLFRLSIALESPRCFVYGIGLITALGALWVTHTRAAYLAVFFQGLLYLLMQYLRNGVLVTVIIVIIFMSFMGFLLGFSIFQNELDRDSLVSIESMQRRFATWPIALQDIVQNPIIGLGYGQQSFEKKHPELGEGFIHKNIHNTLLQKLVQCGVPGAIIFCLIFSKILKAAFQVWNQQVNVFAGKFALAIMIMVIGVIVRTMFDDMFLGNIVYLFWLLVGLFFCSSKVPATNGEVSRM